jgi:hypothetical protein
MALLTLPPTTITEKTKKVAIPLNVGVKINPNPFFVLGFEVGVRYSFDRQFGRQ